MMELVAPAEKARGGKVSRGQVRKEFRKALDKAHGMW